MADYSMTDIAKLRAAALDRFRNKPADIMQRAPASFSDASPAPEGVSVDRSIPASTAAAPAAAPAQPTKTSLKDKLKSWFPGGLTGALKGAAHGIQANVGTTEPGQEWMNGIQRGLVGAGMLAAENERNRAASQRASEGLSAKLDLLFAKEAMKPKEPTWMEKFNLTEAGKDRRAAAANAAAIDRAAKLKALETKSGRSEKDLLKLKQDAYQQAYKEAESAGLLDDPESQGLIEKRTNQIYEFWLDPKSGDFSDISR